MRRTAILVAACAAALAASASSAVAAGGTACQLAGNWTISPGLKLQPSGNSSLSGTATLSNCQGTGGPASGTLYVGGSTITIGGVAYRAPAAAPGSGSCVHPVGPASYGPAPELVVWNDGTVTVFDFNLFGPGVAAQYYHGNAQPSVTLKTVAVNPTTGQPSSVVIPTTQYAGASVGGVGATSGGDFADCAGSGMSSLASSGTLAFYSTS